MLIPMFDRLTAGEVDLGATVLCGRGVAGRGDGGGLLREEVKGRG